MRHGGAWPEDQTGVRRARRTCRGIRRVITRSRRRSWSGATAHDGTLEYRADSPVPIALVEFKPEKWAAHAYYPEDACDVGGEGELVQQP